MALQLITDFIESGKVSNFDQPGPNYRFAKESVKVPFLIPGHVYTFVSRVTRGNDSLPSIDDYVLDPTKSKSKPYIDNWPIFISLGGIGQVEFGFNLKMMPPLLRRRFLQMYLMRISPVLANLVDGSGNFIEYQKRIRQPEMNAFRSIDKSFLMSIAPYSGIKFELLVDKYNRDEMSYLSLIDWPDVPNVGEINYSTDSSVSMRSRISDFLK